MNRELVCLSVLIVLLGRTAGNESCRECSRGGKSCVGAYNCGHPENYKSQCCTLCLRNAGERCGGRCGLCKSNFRCRKDHDQKFSICVREHEGGLSGKAVAQMVRRSIDGGCNDYIGKHVRAYGEEWRQNCTIYRCKEDGKIELLPVSCDKLKCNTIAAKRCCSKCQIPKGSVSCSGGEMTVTIPKTRFVNTVISRLTLRDPSCTSIDTRDKIILQTKLNQCGTTKLFSRHKVMYQNKVVLRYSPDDTIYRLVQHVSCSLPIKTRPVSRGIRVTLRSEGVKMFYTTKGGRILPRKKKRSVKVGDNVYVSIMETRRKGFNRKKILVDECVLIPAKQNNNKNARNYVLIKDGCKKDKLLEVLRVWKFGIWFSLKAKSLFGSDGSLMVLKCIAYVCDDTLPQSLSGRCKESCLKPGV